MMNMVIIKLSCKASVVVTYAIPNHRERETKNTHAWCLF